MNASTGRTMDDGDHIRQSIRDILTTKIGTRLQRRDYGSLLPEMIDQPGNDTNMLRLMAATVMAIAQWEPRISIQQVKTYINTTEHGGIEIDMQATRTDGPQAGTSTSISIPLGLK